MRATTAAIFAFLPLVPGTGQVPAPHGSTESAGLSFVRNEGQWPQAVRFAARCGPMTVLLQSRGLALHTLGTQQRASVGLVFAGAADANVVGEGPLSTRYSFLCGANASLWRSDVPAFRQVVYQGLYPGVDLRVRDESGQVEYDLELAADADLSRVHVRCEGASLSLGANGDLLLATPAGELRQTPPRTFAVEGASRRAVASRYRLLDPQTFGFEVLAPHRGALVVDPGLVWGSYLGGSAADVINSSAVDGNGGVVVAGTTASFSDFPVTFFTAPYQPFPGGGLQDAFVARYSSDGRQLLWCTFFGGNGKDVALDVAVDRQGDVVLCGTTDSTLRFPLTSNAVQNSYQGGVSDGFVARLTGNGRSLLFSTYLGGSAEEQATALDVNLAGDVVVTGWTSSPDFPVRNAHQATLAGSTDAFVVNLSTTAPAPLTYGTYFGGAGSDKAWDVKWKRDQSGRILFCGEEDSGASFPSTHGTHWRRSDCFVTLLNPLAASQNVFTRLFGGISYDAAYSLAEDLWERVTITGATHWEYGQGAGFPVTAGAYQPGHGGPFPFGSYGADAFVTRIDLSNPGGLEYSTFLGGGGNDYGVALVLDPSGIITVKGATSGAFPVTPGCVQPAYGGGGSDCFLARMIFAGVTPFGRLLYATYLGGPGDDTTSRGLHVTSTGEATLAGQTSGSFPHITQGVPQPNFGGGPSDGFVVRVDLTPAGVTRLGSSPPPCAGHAANHLGLLSAYRVPNAGFGFYNTGGPEWCPFGLNLLGTALATPIQTPTFTLHVNPIVILGPTRSDQCGYTEQVIPVPNDPSLVNASFALQTVWYQFGSPCQNAALLSASDALRIP